MRNALFLVLVLAVGAVTALNQYTTNQTIDQFNAEYKDVDLWAAHEAQLSGLNELVGYAQQTVHDLGKLALGFRDERDVAIGAYNELYDQAVGMYQTMCEEERYIQLLNKVCERLYTTAQRQTQYIAKLVTLLKDNGIEIPDFPEGESQVPTPPECVPITPACELGKPEHQDLPQHAWPNWAPLPK